MASASQVRVLNFPQALIQLNRRFPMGRHPYSLSTPFSTPQDGDAAFATRRIDTASQSVVDRRHFLSLLSGAAATMGLVACGGSSSGSSSASGAQADAPLP